MDVCIHLEKIIKHELNRGNSINLADNNWSSGITVITLKNALDADYYDNIKFDDWVEYWENLDSHYPIQKGFVCKICKISIASPTY